MFFNGGKGASPNRSVFVFPPAGYAEGAYSMAIGGGLDDNVDRLRGISSLLAKGRPESGSWVPRTYPPMLLRARG